MLTQGFEVWCQGGPADHFVCTVAVEPCDEIWVTPDPAYCGRYLLASSGAPGAIGYVRQPAVEQFAHERIYYPKGHR